MIFEPSTVFPLKYWQLISASCWQKVTINNIFLQIAVGHTDSSAVAFGNLLADARRWCKYLRLTQKRCSSALHKLERVSDVLSLMGILKRPALICMSGTVRNSLTSVLQLQIQLGEVSNNIRGKERNQFVGYLTSSPESRRNFSGFHSDRNRLTGGCSSRNCFSFVHFFF